VGLLSKFSGAVNRAKIYTYQTGMCLKFVRTRYPVAVKYPHAASAWSRTKLRRTGTPPAGAPVWWTGGSRGYGHVAISAGGGYCYSTDIPGRGRVGKIAISALTRSWGQTYRGWSEDINDVRVMTATRTQAKYTPPRFPKGIGPGKSKPSAVALQRALKKAGYMPKSVRENANYGPQTQAAVVRFHNSSYGKKYKARGVRNDPRIGPKGWAALFRKAYG